ncbi:MAG TPA: LysR family transcriptional regulator [Ramlibacter sp.]|nr:LysR family transcriptional regulator [Ramlibacter sp.]
MTSVSRNEPATPWAPTLRQLEVLRCVVNLGSLSRAADALHVSQPSVTQTLAQLEKSCGVDLLTRRHGRMTPTPQARALLGEIDHLFEAMGSVTARFEALRAPQPDELRFACLHALAASVLPAAVGHFRRLFPEVRLQLMVESSRAIREALVAGKVDFAVVGDEADVSGLSSSPFYQLPAICAMPARHPLARRSRIGPADLAGEPLIALVPTDRARLAIEKVFADAGAPWDPVITTPYSLTQCELVLAGAGIAITNPVVAHRFEALGVACVPFEPEIVFRANLAFGSAYQANRAAQELISLMRQALMVNA